MPAGIGIVGSCVAGSTYGSITVPVNFDGSAVSSPRLLPPTPLIASAGGRVTPEITGCGFPSSPISVVSALISIVCGVPTTPFVATFAKMWPGCTCATSYSTPFHSNRCPTFMNRPPSPPGVPFGQRGCLSGS